MTGRVSSSPDARFPSPPAEPASRPRRSQLRRQEQRARQRATTAYVAALAVLGLMVPVLGWVGVRAILDSSDGQVVDPQLDPEEPGYQALVSPSPTLLLAQLDEEGTLAGVAVLGLADEASEGGGVLLVPPATVGDVPDIGELPLDAAYAFSGLDALRATAEFALGIGIDEAVVVDAADWAAVLELTGPLRLTNPDALRAEDGTVAFPSGAIELAPADVPRYAALLRPDETRLNRLLRQELVWRAWLDALSDASGEVAFPGEEGRGLARFLPAIAAGQARIEPLPVQQVEGDDGSELFEVDPDALGRVLPEIIPFPASNGERSRPLVRILAGSGPGAGTAEVAGGVVRAGGQVVIVGNADRFDYDETLITYWDPSHRESAEAVAETLGFGTVAQVDEVDESADIVVVIGRDVTRSTGS